jgi:hypothetical protein
LTSIRQCIRFVGAGAFGRVYEAHDPHLDRPVASRSPARAPACPRGA